MFWVGRGISRSYPYNRVFPGFHSFQTMPWTTCDQLATIKGKSTEVPSMVFKLLSGGEIWIAGIPTASTKQHFPKTCKCAAWEKPRRNVGEWPFERRREREEEERRREKGTVPHRLNVEEDLPLDPQLYQGYQGDKCCSTALQAGSCLCLLLFPWPLSRKRSTTLHATAIMRRQTTPRFVDLLSGKHY